MNVPRKLKLASLFETRRRVDPKLAVYPTVAAHLDAAVAGKKGLSLFSIGPLDELGEAGGRGRGADEAVERLAGEAGYVW